MGGEDVTDNELLQRILSTVTDVKDGLGRVEKRLDRVEERLTRVEERLDRVEERLTRVEERLDRVEERLDRVEERLDRVEERLDRVEERLDRVEERLDRVEERLDRVESDVTEIKLTLENETNRNILLLVEGHVQTAEKVDSFADDIDVIKFDMGVVKAVVTTHSSQLTKLQKAE